jgi:hypothetical protein
MPMFVALALAMGAAPVPEAPIRLPEEEDHRRRRHLPPEKRASGGGMGVRTFWPVQGDTSCPYKHKRRKNDRVCQFCGRPIPGTG